MLGLCYVLRYCQSANVKTTTKIGTNAMTTGSWAIDTYLLCNLALLVFALSVWIIGYRKDR